MSTSLFHEWFEQVWNKGDESAIDRLLDPGVILRDLDGSGGGESRGPDAFKAHFHRLRSAFPDVHVTVHGAFEMNGYVAGRWTVTGTHTGEGLGFPPTNRKIEIPGVSFVHVENGRAAEVWDSWDVAGMMRQLGESSAGAAGAG
jgi:steroid delta-isomerase-like uncharacterized protein